MEIMRRKYGIRYMSVACFFSNCINTTGKSSNQKNLSSVNIHTVTCNFIACHFTQSQIRNKCFFGNFPKFHFF